MDTDVICPDCGKVIAPAGTVDEAARCRCGESLDDQSPVQQRPSRAAAIPEPVVSEQDVDDDFDPEPTETDSPDDTDAVGDRMVDQNGKGEKNCFVCGKNLDGRIRLKDHLGRYWCRECAKADERAKKREESLRCPDCGRVFPEKKLVYFQTTRVCTSCYKEREKVLEKKILKANISTKQKEQEFKQIKWLAIIAGGLILLALINHFLF